MDKSIKESQTNKLFYIFCFILTYIGTINKVLAYEYFKLNDYKTGDLKEKNFNDFSLCQWIKIDNIFTDEILQITKLESILSSNKPENIITNIDDKKYSSIRPKEIYKYNGKKKIYGLLKSYSYSKSCSYELLLHHDSLEKKIQSFPVDHIFENKILYENKNWIYFCESFILKNQVYSPETKNFDNEFLNIYEENKNFPSFYFTIKIEIKKEFFFKDIDFINLKVDFKMKNTLNFIRGRNLKIFYDLNNSDVIDKILFKSAFRNELILKDNNYVLVDYKLIKNTRVNEEYENILTNIDQTQLENLLNSSEFDEDLNFRFSNIFKKIKYNFVEKNSIKFDQEQKDSYIEFNFSDFYQDMILKFTKMLTKISNNQVLNYLKNNFQWNLNINNELDTFLDLSNENDSYNLEYTNKILNSIILEHGSFILKTKMKKEEIFEPDQDTDEYNPKIKINESNFNYVYPYRTIIKVDPSLLFTSKYLGFVIKDSNRKLLYDDYEINIFNDFPKRNILQLVNKKENVKNTTVITERFPSRYRPGAYLTNCFWFNLETKVSNSIPSTGTFEVLTEFENEFSNPSAKLSLNTKFLSKNKKFNNIQIDIRYNITKTKKFDFVRDYVTLDVDINPLVGDKKWNYYCSMIKSDIIFEANYFINEGLIFSFKDNLNITKIISYPDLSYGISNDQVLFSDFRLYQTQYFILEKLQNLYLQNRYYGIKYSESNMQILNIKYEKYLDNKFYYDKNFKEFLPSERYITDKYFFFDSERSDFLQLFLTGFPKVVKVNDKVLELKIRFNPDFILKTFVMEKENLKSFLINNFMRFKILRENKYHEFFNNIKNATDLFSSKGDYSNDYKNNKIKIVIETSKGDIMIYLRLDKLLEEFSIFYEERIDYISPMNIVFRIYDFKYNICFSSLNMKIEKTNLDIDPNKKYHYESYDFNIYDFKNLSKGVLKPLIISENFDLPELYLSNNFNKFNSLTYRVVYPSIIFKTKKLNFTSILSKNETNFFLSSRIISTKSDSQNVTLFSGKNDDYDNYFEFNFTDKFPEILYNNDRYFSRYTAKQIITFSPYDKITNDLLIEFIADRNMMDLENKNSKSVDVIINFLIENGGNIENDLDIIYNKWIYIDFTNTSKNKNKELDNFFYEYKFKDHYKPITIYQDMNFINMKNLNQSMDRHYVFTEEQNFERMHFTIENNDNILNNYRNKILFKDNFKELELNNKDDLDFLKILKNLKININLINNYENRYITYSLYLETTDKEFINSLQQNEYFFVEVYPCYSNNMQGNYEDKINRTELNKVFESTIFQRDINYQIKINLERFSYKSYSYFNSDSGSITNYYILENTNMPVSFSLNKFKNIILEFFKIDNERSEFKSNGDKFSFNSIKIKKLSNKIITLEFLGVKSYTGENYLINILSSIKGLIYKDSKNLLKLDIFPVSKYKLPNIEPIKSCDTESPFLFIKTNTKFYEYPNMKDFKISFFDYNMGHMINPNCYKLITKLFLDKKQIPMEDISNFFIFDINYYYLNNLPILSMQFSIGPPNPSYKVSLEKLKLKSPYLVDLDEENLKYAYLIFQEDQNFRIDLLYKIFKSSDNRLKLFNNYIYRMKGCNSFIKTFDYEKIIGQYFNVALENNCIISISHFLNEFYSINLNFFDFQNSLSISTNGKQTFNDDLILNFKSFAFFHSNKILKRIVCSKNIFILSNNITTNFTVKTFNYKKIEQSLKSNNINGSIFKNKKYKNYKYRIYLDKILNNSTNFLTLDDFSNIFKNLKFQDYVINFKVFQNKSQIDKIFYPFVNNTQYNIDYIYLSLTCDICLTTDFCGKAKSNMIELYNNMTVNFSTEIDDSLKNNTNNGQTGNNDITNKNITSNNDTIKNQTTDPDDTIKIANITNNNITLINKTTNDDSINKNNISNIYNNSSVTDDNNNFGQNKTGLDTNSSTLIKNISSNDYNKNISQTSKTLIDSLIKNLDEILNSNKSEKFTEIISDNPSIIINTYINVINNTNSTVITTPIKNYSIIDNIELKINTMKNNADLLDELNKNKTITREILIKETINVNLMISNTNCSQDNTKTYICKSNKEFTQEKILNILNSTFDCEKIEEIISQNKNKSLIFDKEKFMNSVFSVYFSSSNEDSFSEKNVMLMNHLSKCLIKYGPLFLSNIKKNTNEISEEFIDLKNHFSKLISSTFSNMLNIVSTKNYEEVIQTNFSESMNNSLICNTKNLDLKKNVEENGRMIFKLNSNSYNVNLNETKLKLKTENIVYYNQKIKYFENPIIPVRNNIRSIENLTKESIESTSKIKKEKSKRLLSNIHNKTNFTLENLRNLMLRNLEIEYDIVTFKDLGMEMSIFFPVEYLKNIYNSNITNYGIILYSKYPLSSPNSKNFSEKVVAVKLFDKNYNEIQAKNLTYPIHVLIKKPINMVKMRKCIFFDENILNWNTEGCISNDLGNILHCECYHLTDFSIAKYNPVSLIEDVFNVISEALIITDFEAFNNIDFENAYMIYIFGIMILLYILALIITIKKDSKDENGIYIYEIDFDFKCCSKDEILKRIKDFKYLTENREKEKKINALKILQFKIESSMHENNSDPIAMVSDVEQNNNSLKNDNFTFTEKNSEDIDVKLDIDSENHEKEISLNYNENNRKKDKKKVGFLDKILKKINKKKKKNNTILNEEKQNNHNDLSTDNLNNQESIFNKEISANGTTSIEMKNMESNGEENSVKNSIFLKKNSNPINMENMDLNKKERGLSSIFTIDQKILIDGLNIKIYDQTIQHDEFILKLYKNENKEFKDEINKFFYIRKKTRRQLGHMNSFPNNSNSIINCHFPDTNPDKMKNDSYSGKLENSKRSFTTNNNENSIDCYEIEEKFHSKATLRKKSETNLIEDIQKEEEEDFMEVKLKNYKIIKYISLLIYFFRNQYRLLCLFFSNDMLFSKSNFLTLTFSKIIATLGIGTMLSLRMNSKKNKSSSGYIFTNRELAISLATIIFVEILYSIIEIFLTKRKVLKNYTQVEKYKEKKKAKIIYIIAYFLVFLISLFFIVNTIWISLKQSESEAKKKFLNQFFKCLIIDYFVKEVVIILIKAYLYFLIIKDDDLPAWKRYLITILAIASL